MAVVIIFTFSFRFESGKIKHQFCADITINIYTATSAMITKVPHFKVISNKRNVVEICTAENIFSQLRHNDKHLTKNGRQMVLCGRANVPEILPDTE
jgi:hypothetical protein